MEGARKRKNKPVRPDQSEPYRHDGIAGNKEESQEFAPAGLTNSGDDAVQNIEEDNSKNVPPNSKSGRKSRDNFGSYKGY